jgi:hypothetical protein
MTILVALSLIVGQGWVGEGRVSPPDTSYEQHPVIGFDRFGVPMIVWSGLGPGYNMEYTRWLGAGWDSARAAGYDSPGVVGRFPNSLSLDDSGHLWCIYDNDFISSQNNESCCVAARIWYDTAWGPEIPITGNDSSWQTGGGRAAFGGGQMWCVFEGSQNELPGAVWASHWDGSAQKWGVPMRVSPIDSFAYWGGVIAVDHQGEPHVVFNDVDRYRIFYSYYDGTRWTDPLRVDDSTVDSASWMAAPSMCIDTNDNLHLTYTGCWSGASHRTVFYTRFDGHSWSPQVSPNSDTVHDVWYSSVAARSADDVWVAWDRQGEGSSVFRVHASHFDGTSWSDAARLDSDSSYQNIAATIALDSADDPWATWPGSSDPDGTIEVIYYNRYAPWVAVAQTPNANVVRAPKLTVASIGSGGLKIRYASREPGPVQISIFDQTGRRVRKLEMGQTPAGVHSVVWDGRTDQGANAPGGLYFCQVIAGKQEKVAKGVLIRRGSERD